MLETPGEVITREELRELLWGQDTFVDFEHGLSAAINKLREVLGDSASTPRFIETIPRRGYRFIGEVSGDAAPDVDSSHESSVRPQYRAAIATAMTPRPGRSRDHPRQIATTLAGSAILISSIGIIWWVSRAPAKDGVDHGSTRFEIPVPGTAVAPVFRLSPNGRYLAIAAGELWLRPFDSLEARPLPGTKGAICPFWSPDSRFLGFFAEGKLKKISVTGGLAQTICACSPAHGASWNRDGTIVFAPDPGQGIVRVPATGGPTAEVTKIPAHVWETHRYPEFLPDGRRFLFLSISGNAERSGVYVGSLNGHAPVRILTDASNAIYAPGHRRGSGGHLLFRRGTALMAQHFDPDRLTLPGEAVAISQLVGNSDGELGRGAFSVSESDVLAYQAGGAAVGGNQFVWVDRNGKRERVVANAVPSKFPEVSPDGKRIVFSIDNFDGTRDLWIQTLENGALSRFTFAGGLDIGAIWSPDGRQVAFYRFAGGQFELHAKPTSGAAMEERLARLDAFARPSDWSPDGKFIVFSLYSGARRCDLWILPMERGRKAYPYLQTDADEYSGQLSPDGRWMAYVSAEGGQRNIWVQPIPRNGAKWQISTKGGSQPRWRQDGRKLFYVATDEKLMAVPVRIGKTFEAGSHEPVSNISVSAPPGPSFFYKPAADGSRFLVSELAAGKTPQITIELNWQAGTKR
jgi:Tol biopolymer transport system component/DNA-binding winged helix-turn-helix (wHTH) protein